MHALSARAGVHAMRTLRLIVAAAVLAAPSTAAWAAAPAPQPGTATPLTVERCVWIALNRNAKIAEARGSAAQYVALLAEVEANYYPKLSALGWIAPMYSMEGGALDRNVTRKWKHLGDWGPYTHLEALFAQPLYTFGRLSAGVDAAEARLRVERARVRQARHAVAAEVRKLFYTRLYALSLLPTLRTAAKIVDEAMEKAQEGYDKGDGSVTQVDLMKLSYADAEVTRYLRLAEDGARLAEAALRHTMGLAPDADVTFAGKRLRGMPAPAPPLADALAEASRRRPEWTQLRAGAKAARSLQRAEVLANAPILLLAGSLQASWAPTVDDTRNPFHYDRYNDLEGGVALAIKWDFDPAKAAAKADSAKAQAAQVEALRRYASSGIPTQVFQAWQASRQHCELVPVAKQGVKATTKWQAFAAAAYRMGTGDAKDLLEGLVMALKAKETYYGQLRDCYIAHAELHRAMGRDDGVEAPAPKQAAPAFAPAPAPPSAPATAPAVATAPVPAATTAPATE